MLEIRESATSDTFTGMTKRPFHVSRKRVSHVVRLLRVNDLSTGSWYDGTMGPRERRKVREARGYLVAGDEP